MKIDRVVTLLDNVSTNIGNAVHGEQISIDLGL